MLSNLPRMRYAVRLLAVMMLLFVLAVPSVAVGVTVVAGDAPAVEAPPPAVDDEEAPWTSRFLAPTVLALGVVAVGGALLFYGVRVRGRYRVRR